MKFNQIITVLCIAFFISACYTEGRFRATPTDEPTASHAPKPGQAPTDTPVPTPTHTPIPTAIPIPMGENVRVYTFNELCSAPVAYCSPLKIFLGEEEVVIISYEGNDWYKVEAHGLTENSPPIIGYLAKNSIKFATAASPGR